MASVTNQDDTSVALVATEEVINTLGSTNVESTEPDKKDDEEKKEEEKKEEETKEEEKEKIFIGGVSEVKELYAKYDKDGNRSWSEDTPDDLVEAAENEKSLKYAVLVRKSKSTFCPANAALFSRSE